jgi:hypothetical protein
MNLIENLNKSFLELDSVGSSNSSYTTALVKLIDKYDDIALLLREVRDEVMAKTN